MCIFHARRAAICAAAAHDEFIKYLALLMISELQAADQVSQVNQVNRAESSGIEWTQREGREGCIRCCSTQQVQCNNLAATYDSAAIANKPKWPPLLIFTEFSLPSLPSRISHLPIFYMPQLRLQVLPVWGARIYAALWLRRRRCRS